MPESSLGAGVYNCFTQDAHHLLPAIVWCSLVLHQISTSMYECGCCTETIKDSCASDHLHVDRVLERGEQFVAQFGIGWDGEVLTSGV